MTDGMNPNLFDDATACKELFDNANDLIQSVDENGRFLYVNKKWRDVLGYTEEEARRMAFPDIIHQNHLQACFSLFAELKKGKSFDNIRTQFVAKSGRVIDVDGNISVRMKNGEFLSTWGIFRDVTLRNQREQELDHIAKTLVRRDFELLQTNDILRIRDEQIAKEHELNRAKSEFVSLASHQLKTPLTIIKWYIDMLTAGYAGDSLEKQNEYLGKIHSNTERMVELIDAFLNVSRLELGIYSIKKEPVNLKDKMELILKNFEPKIKEKNLKLLRNYAPHQSKHGTGQAPSNFVFAVDTKMIQIIFENLVSNAIKYTPHGGEIQIKMSRRSRGSSSATAVGTGQKKGNEILIGVVDTGIGIPVDQQSQIFTKFFRADNATSYKADGSGLGLYIVKTVVEKIGGKIWFRSPAFAKASAGKPAAADKNGTAFYVTFYPHT